MEPAMHPDGWAALRRVARGEPPGSPELREMLMARGLIEWEPGKGSCRLTEKGRRELG